MFVVATLESPPTGGMAGFVLAFFHWFEMRHKGPYTYFLSLIKCLSRKRTANTEAADNGENAQRRTVDVGFTRAFITLVLIVAFLPSLTRRTGMMLMSPLKRG